MKNTEQAKLMTGLLAIWNRDADLPAGVKITELGSGARRIFFAYPDGRFATTVPSRRDKVDALRRDIAKIAPVLPKGITTIRKGGQQ